MKNWENNKILGLDSLVFGISIGIFILICILSIFSIHEYREAKARGIFDKRNPVSEGFLKKQSEEKKELQTVQEIQGWMTFGYINFSFGLPDEYLKESLKITDSKYPKIPLFKYARKNKLQGEIFLEQVRKSVDEWKKIHPSFNSLKQVNFDNGDKKPR